MQRHAIAGRSHAMLTNAPVNITPVELTRRNGRCHLNLGIVGAGEIGGAGDEFGQQRRDDFKSVFTRLAGGNLAGIRHQPCFGLQHGSAKRFGQSARYTAGEFSLDAAFGSSKSLFPGLMRALALVAGLAPCRQNIIRNHKGGMSPAQLFAGAGHFRIRNFTMRLGGAGKIRLAKADDGFSGNHGRLVGFLGFFNGLENGFRVMAVNGKGIPAR